MPLKFKLNVGFRESDKRKKHIIRHDLNPSNCHCIYCNSLREIPHNNCNRCKNSSTRGMLSELENNFSTLNFCGSVQLLQDLV